MLMRLVLFIALIAPLSGIISSDDGYSFTVAEARAAVREHYRYECEEEKIEASLALSRDIREGNARRREGIVHCFHGCELPQW
jgi:hypothetical protein